MKYDLHSKVIDESLDLSKNRCRTSHYSSIGSSLILVLSDNDNTVLIISTLFDEQFRFTLLCHAACEAPLVLPLGGYTYGEKCLFIANDWHAGLVPVYVTFTSSLSE